MTFKLESKDIRVDQANPQTSTTKKNESSWFRNTASTLFNKFTQDPSSSSSAHENVPPLTFRSLANLSTEDLGKKEKAEKEEKRNYKLESPEDDMGQLSASLVDTMLAFDAENPVDSSSSSSSVSRAPIIPDQKPSKLTPASIMHHMTVLRDECQHMAKGQPIKNSYELDDSIKILNNALDAIATGCITGDLETQLSEVFDVSLLVDLEGSMSESVSQLKNVYSIFTCRNDFFDQVKKLPPEQKVTFEPFMKMHKTAVNLLQQQFTIDLAQCPMLLRPFAGKIVDIAYRVE